ncbi:MAG: hypothetical protein IPH12_11220 [Saprospirales bacterium]|nr:hypothetical protein [Saprospirales bacterium]
MSGNGSTACCCGKTHKKSHFLRLQAYERLTLLCDRVAISNTLLRIRTPGMRVAELKGALMLSISQEFDHNTSQQLFVSETLWQIISVAKEQTLTLILKAAEGLDGQADADVLVERLFSMLEEQGAPTALHRALWLSGWKQASFFDPAIVTDW